MKEIVVVSLAIDPKTRTIIPEIGTRIVPPIHPPTANAPSRKRLFSGRKSGKHQNVEGCCNWDTISNFAFCSNQLRLHGQRIVFGDNDSYTIDLIALDHN
jgi:hypothetical protein